MGKRLSRTDYIFTLIFIFMLVCVIAAFFYGLKLGKENTEEQYEQSLKQQEEAELELTAYHQQYLVSFYHTIYLPYRDFQKKWFESINSIELRSTTTDSDSVFKELHNLANKQYQNIVTKTMPNTSPLLKESHEDYLRSLKLFAEAAKEFNPTAKEGTDLISEIALDVYFQEAKQFALSAQHKYYDAILEWNKSVDLKIKSDKSLDHAGLTIQEWDQLNLNEKNSLIAFLIDEGNYFEPFYIQDMTIKVDQLIQNGQAKQMNLNVVRDIVKTLINTGAVRVYDFINSKNLYYQNETLPQLPFFFEQNK